MAKSTLLLLFLLLLLLLLFLLLLLVLLLLLFLDGVACHHSNHNMVQKVQIEGVHEAWGYLASTWHQTCLKF